MKEQPSRKSNYQQEDLSKVKRYSIKERMSKVRSDALAESVQAGSSFADFYRSLPSFLAAKDLKELVRHIINARRNNKPVILMMGAHVIKVGLSPVIIDLMKAEIITCIALNGAGIIHDSEMCLFGQTSEDVAVGLSDGSFGMALETGHFINSAIADGQKDNLGLGECIGKGLIESASPDALQRSILATAYALHIPVTVHVAVGTDIVHQHPDADGAAIGACSFRDFKILAAHVAEMNCGAVAINVGSNVILPEVFLKALTVARNIHGEVANFYTANFDMIQHYRPRVNVVQRPTATGGKGYQFTGHHEIMLPLLAAAIKEAMPA